MPKEFTSLSFPYFLCSLFLFWIAIKFGSENLPPAFLFFAFGLIIVLLMVGFRMKITVYKDHMVLSANFGRVKDEIHFSEIGSMTSSSYAGLVTHRRGMQSEIFRKNLYIKLKTGEEYIITNMEIYDLDGLILALRTSLEAFESTANSSD